MLTAVDLPEGISLEQVTEWYDRFRFYRHSPSREDLIAWLRQFSAEDYTLAAKVLDQVIMISDRDIHQGYHDALAGLPGWAIEPERRVGDWAFVGLGGQAESGPAMLHMFREANRLTSDKHQSLFVTLADLPKLRLTARDTVVFVDDFSGTGDQFGKRWNVYRELVSSEAHTYLFLAAATSRAMSILNKLEDITVRAKLVLAEDQNVLSPDSTIFTDPEKEAILTYCKRADRRNPKGFGQCGLLLVVSRKTPNNSLPILYAHSRKWAGIFPRSLQLSSPNIEIAA